MLTRPQHMPTMRKPITHLHIEGEGAGDMGEVSGSMLADGDGMA